MARAPPVRCLPRAIRPAGRALRQAAVVAEADAVGGRYCEDCHVAQVQDGEGLRSGVRPYALDAQRAEALWRKSEELVHEHF